MKTVEYKVRAVTRYVVTRYESDPEGGSGSVITFGEFDNGDYASRVCQALTAADPGPTFLSLLPIQQSAQEASMARKDGREWFQSEAGMNP
jgi:hypothetical protein